TLEIVNIPPEGQVPALMNAGVPQQIAEAVAEMFAALSAGLVVPSGDRSLSGWTTVDLVIAEYIRRQQAAELSAQTSGIGVFAPAGQQNSEPRRREDAVEAGVPSADRVKE